MPTRAEPFWNPSEQLFARWQSRLASDPRSVHREVQLDLLWLGQFEAVDDDARTIREVLTEMAIEMLIEAVVQQ